MTETRRGRGYRTRGKYYNKLLFTTYVILYYATYNRNRRIVSAKINERVLWKLYNNYFYTIYTLEYSRKKMPAMTHPEDFTCNAFLFHNINYINSNISVYCNNTTGSNENTMRASDVIPGGLDIGLMVCVYILPLYSITYIRGEQFLLILQHTLLQYCFHIDIDDSCW